MAICLLSGLQKHDCGFLLIILSRLKSLQINLQTFSVKRHEAQILSTACGREDRKRTSLPPTTYQSRGRLSLIDQVFSPVWRQKTSLVTCCVTRANGTQVLLDQIRGAEEITMPRAMIGENTEHQLIITAYNHFGASQSDPVTLCVEDMGKMTPLLSLLLSVHLRKHFLEKLVITWTCLCSIITPWLVSANCFSVSCFFVFFSSISVTILVNFIRFNILLQQPVLWCLFCSSPHTAVTCVMFFGICSDTRDASYNRGKVWEHLHNGPVAVGNCRVLGASQILRQAQHR